MVDFEKLKEKVRISFCAQQKSFQVNENTRLKVFSYLSIIVQQTIFL